MRQNARNIQFNVDAYTAKLIGRENVSKLEGAVLEIVKNAYDADANFFCLYYCESHNCIYIIDNGTGMEEEVLKKHWMTIGNSSKKISFKTEKKRIQTGAKGIGRFALDRISDRCEMLTISAKGGLEWLVNWSDFDGNRNLSDVKAKLYDTDENLLEYANIHNWPNTNLANYIIKMKLNGTGTVFRLYGIHDSWDEQTRYKLKNHLENLLPPDVTEDFNIFFFDDETSIEDAKIVSSNIEAFDYKINFEVINERLQIDIIRNEFDFGPNMESFLNKVKIDISEATYFNGIPKHLSFTFKELDESENLIGNYSGVLFFNKISVTKKDQEKFYYKDINGRKNFTKEFGGIKLYRDGFRVRPYGEYGDNDFDWLELSARRNKSPAGLGHPSGAWRVGSEQLVGIVNISRENRNLEDAANRNGIQDGEGFEQLKRILIDIITEFERDRQSVGRKLAEYAKEQDQLEKEIEEVKRLAEARREWEEKQAKQINRKQTGNVNNINSNAPVANPEKVSHIISSLEEKNEQEVQELKDEIKMLQTLATTGIITNMFMHEIRTLTNNIGLELDSAYEAIKYDKNLEDAFNNIQQAIVFKKHFASWFRVTIESVRKDKRRRKLCNIKEMLKDYFDTWRIILNRNGIDLYVKCDDIQYRCFPFDIENVISNLISNSLASFERETEDVLDEKKIIITLTKTEEGFWLRYEDTGWGLIPKYKERPDLITEAFESDRTGNSSNEEGTGMGMWIVKKTALEYDGDIDLSENMKINKGFITTINFGGKYV